MNGNDPDLRFLSFPTSQPLSNGHERLLLFWSYSDHSLTKNSNRYDVDIKTWVDLDAILPHKGGQELNEEPNLPRGLGTHLINRAGLPLNKANS